MKNDIPIDIETAKRELLRINEILDKPHLLIGGLAVQRYVSIRPSQDIDLVCSYDKSIELVDKLYPSHEWDIKESRDNAHRPSYEIKHKFKEYGEIVLGFKITERQSYDFIDWEFLLKSGEKYEYQQEYLGNIVIPTCSHLAFTKLISFLDRDKSNTNKRIKDLKDLTNLSNHKKFHLDDFLSTIRRNKSQDYIKNNFILSDEEELVFSTSIFRRQNEIFGEPIIQSVFADLVNSSDKKEAQSEQQIKKNRLSRSLVPDKYYIERDESKRLLELFAAVIEQSQEKPLLFNICGIGGVGKTTLRNRLQKAHEEVDFVEVCFATTSDIGTPLKLMQKLHQQAIKLVSEAPIVDSFTQQKQKFEKTLSELSSVSADGKAISGEESKKITNWFERLLWLQLIVSTSSKKNPFEPSFKSGLSALAPVSDDAENLREWVQQKIRIHPATKDNPELNALMSEPVSQLTQAFISSLTEIFQSTKRPLVLVLDTYEKAQSHLNQWLCKYLVKYLLETNRSIYFVVIGRRSLQKDEGWRKLNQEEKFIHEATLKKFDRKDTHSYLEKIGIDKNKHYKIYKATQGLPYYLNWIREQREKGDELDFSKGNQAIADLLLQGTDSQQRKILQVVSCCRWFNLEMLEYLLENDASLQGNIDNDDTAETIFEWLKSSDFVEITEGYYSLDDVARDVFRLSYYDYSHRKFSSTNKLLANYFKQQADELYSSQSLLPEPYEDEDWQEVVIEFLYYSFFAKGKEGLLQYIEQIFIAVYLRKPNLFLAPFAFIRTQINEDNERLLSSTTNKFLKNTEMFFNFGWIFIDEFPGSYQIKFEGENAPSEEKAEAISKQIEPSIKHLLKYVDNLENGFGKFLGLIYKSLHCNNYRESSDTLLQAKNQIEQFLTYCESKLKHSIFFTLGNSFFANTQLYEYSLDCYEKALGFDQSYAQTFMRKGNALNYLEKNEDALESLQKALKLEPELLEASIHIGNVLLELRRYEEALAAYNQVSRINPNDDSIINCQALTLSFLKDFDGAIAAINKAIALEPEEAIYIANRGIILAREGKYNQAFADCEQAIKQDSSHVSGYYAKACCHALKGEIEPAIDNLRKAINIAPYVSRSEAKHNPDFDNIQDDERFRALVYPEQNL